MTVSIIHAFLRWALDLFAPGSGRRRAGPPPAVPAPAHLPAVPPEPLPLPAHRSPYGLDAPLDGGASPLVRPYLAAEVAW